MLLRKRRRRSELSTGSPTGVDGQNSVFEFEDARPNPEQIYGQKQSCQHLLRSIETLPQQLRSVAELRIVRERSIQETQEILGLTEAAVKARMFRARARLIAAHETLT